MCGTCTVRIYLGPHTHTHTHIIHKNTKIPLQSADCVGVLTHILFHLFLPGYDHRTKNSITTFNRVLNIFFVKVLVKHAAAAASVADDSSGRLAAATDIASH